jgi:hypothetical protein
LALITIEGESIALIIPFDVKHPSLRPIPSSLGMFLFYKPTLIKKLKHPINQGCLPQNCGGKCKILRIRFV